MEWTEQRGKHPLIIVLCINVLAYSNRGALPLKEGPLRFVGLALPIVSCPLIQFNSYYDSEESLLLIIADFTFLATVDRGSSSAGGR
jgi:hypothetical protein